LKKRLLESGEFEYKCVECGIEGVYNSKPLTLQLDHKNGINDDNRKENLRFLCHNCHSQTETFGTKRFKKQYETKKQQHETEQEKWKRIEAGRKFNPSKEELEKLVKANPMTRVGKLFGVSDNAIRKRCVLFGIDWL
jgi:hypothetical protein